MRAERGNKLICYMGDDRRGGHWWKWISNGTIHDPRSKANSALFESGRLFVARFNADGTGRWIPLELNTSTNPNRPSDLVSGQVAQQVPATVGDRVDNLIFDRLANLWGVTDVSTGLHNGVGDGPTPSTLPVNHTGVGSGATGGGNLVAVFGNNWMFFVPTLGPNAGQLFPFAIGPTRSEMTGPAFVGNTIVISVQHPGEDSPTRAALALNPTHTRDIEVLSLDGTTVVSQTRVVPVGSQWPGNIAAPATNVARPAVIGIQRKKREWRGHWEHDDE